MTKKIVLIGIGGAGKSVLTNRIPPQPELIRIMPALSLFKDVKIGQKFKWKNKEYKKVSSFSAYRNKIGLYPFVTSDEVEIIS